MYMPSSTYVIANTRQKHYMYQILALDKETRPENDVNGYTSLEAKAHALFYEN